MNKIAFIYDGIIINWSTIIIVLAIVCAVCLCFAMAARKPGLVTATALALPIALLLSLILGRLLHWYCRGDEYQSLAQAFSDFSAGGFSIIGVAVGCFAAAALVRLTGLCSSLGSLLDALSPGAALGIAIGRLSFLFNYADRGKIFIENEACRCLPLGSAVVNSTSGATEWRFATFFVQALLAGLICLVCIALFYRFEKLEKRGGKGSDGSIFVVFALCWLSGDILLDSTRYDALFLPSNGFVSFMQIFAIVVIALILFYLSFQSVKFNRLKWWHFLLWVLCLAGLGCAGYMEYYVQRHGDLYMMCYSVMGSGLLVSLVCMLVMLGTTLRKKCGTAETADEL